MEENRTPDTGKHEDFRKVQKADRGLMFRILAIGVVLYWLAELVIDYFKGGPDAPSLTLLIVAIIVLGGGAALVGILAWKAWKAEKALAAMTEEEVADMQALREADEE